MEDEIVKQWINSIDFKKLTSACKSDLDSESLKKQNDKYFSEEMTRLLCELKENFGIPESSSEEMISMRSNDNVNWLPRGSAKSFLNVAYERYVESLHWSFYFRYYHIINNKRCMTDVNFYKWLVTHHLIEIGYVEQAAWDFETALKRFFGEE